jgi:ribosome modulation factor
MKEFDEGYKAFFDNKQMENCPYAKGTERLMAWQDGFVEAAIDDSDSAFSDEDFDC